MNYLKSKLPGAGFTLVELLVVISIIGVLATIALVSFGPVQKQARDTQRKSDLNQYQGALENYANKNNGYFPSRSTGAASVTLCQTDLALSSCPEDPHYSVDNSYIYDYQSNGSGSGTADATQYVLWVKLENTANYWVVCSGGKVGSKARAAWSNPGAGACPI